MQKLSQSQKIVKFLKDNPDKKFNARQIAEQIVTSYPEEYAEKNQILALKMKSHLFLR